MPQGIRLLVGLGNPGEEYRDTRHNVGFSVAEAIDDEVGMELSYDNASKALVGTGKVRSQRFLLAKPLTYMNRCGRSVQQLVRVHSLSPDDLLIIYDDINLPPGQIRLRGKGGAGGHNGVQHIVDALGTNAFPRLRIGIGNDFRRGGQVEYVLAPFSKEQRPLIEEAITKARDAALCFVTDGLATAMNRYN